MKKGQRTEALQSRSTMTGVTDCAKIPGPGTFWKRYGLLGMPGAADRRETELDPSGL